MVTISKGKNDDNSISIEDYYPYGTSLSFDKDLIEELDLQNCKVGQKVKVSGVAIVESTSENETPDGKNQSISLQFTEIEVVKDSKEKSEILYKD